LLVLACLKNQGYCITILGFLSTLKHTRISAFVLLCFKNSIAHRICLLGPLHNMNNHQKSTFHPLGDFLNPALALLGLGLRKSPSGQKLNFANHPYLCKGLLLFYSVRNNSMSLATVTSKGQVTIPTDIRQFLHLNAEDKIKVMATKNGEAIIRPISKTVDKVFCSLKRSVQKPISVEEMNEGAAKHSIFELI